MFHFSTVRASDSHVQDQAVPHSNARTIFQEFLKALAAHLGCGL
jgi:hypothetical protein